MLNAREQAGLYPRSGPFRTIAAAGLVLLLAGSAVLRNSLWASDSAIYLDALKKSPRKERVRYNLGNALAREGKYREALVHFTAARDLLPGRSENHNQIANIYFIFGRTNEAIDEWRSAIELDPKNFEALFNLAQALELAGKKDDAVIYYRRFLEGADATYALQLEKASRYLSGSN